MLCCSLPTKEALTLLRGIRNGYRTPVSDIALRGRVDGWAVAGEARGNYPDFPIIYMSAASAAVVQGRSEQHHAGEAICTRSTRHCPCQSLNKGTPTS